MTMNSIKRSCVLLEIAKRRNFLLTVKYKSRLTRVSEAISSSNDFQYGRIYSQDYLKILSDQVHPMFLNGNAIIQNNNAHIHKAKVVTKCIDV